MRIFTDYIAGISLFLTQTNFFGFSLGTVIIASCLIILVIAGIVFALRLANELLCVSKQRTPDYLFIKKADREWYILAAMLLGRAECVVGRGVRTIVRAIPGIKLNDAGAFDSLGAVPFEGLLAVARVLHKEAGILTLVPLFMNKDTRRVLHLISH
ncbi:MAG TPA: hypothetical protein VJ579_00470 [Candidatus Paceibacterota bacterium]|nr:hypothetical protein [Candidatus Paceibacterota bacterium]